MAEISSHQIEAAATLRLPEDRQLVLRVMPMPADANSNGDIFGGWIMAQMDLAGGNLALRRARGRAATVAVEAMTFISPVAVGDEVTIYGRIVSTGRTSMRIAVEAWKRDWHGETVTRVTSAVFVFVAIDEARRPRPLPPE